MNFLVYAEVLAVGIGDFGQCMENLPVRVTYVDSGFKAASSLKNKNYDAVVSSWNLSDMNNGKFLQGLKLIRPKVSTIAIVDHCDVLQEIKARSIGVNAVISNKAGDVILNNILADILKISAVEFETANSI